MIDAKGTTNKYISYWLIHKLLKQGQELYSQHANDNINNIIKVRAWWNQIYNKWNK